MRRYNPIVSTCRRAELQERYVPAFPRVRVVSLSLSRTHTHTRANPFRTLESWTICNQRRRALGCRLRILIVVKSGSSPRTIRFLFVAGDITDTRYTFRTIWRAGNRDPDGHLNKAIGAAPPKGRREPETNDHWFSLMFSAPIAGLLR